MLPQVGDGVVVLIAASGGVQGEDRRDVFLVCAGVGHRIVVGAHVFLLVGVQVLDGPAVAVLVIHVERVAQGAAVVRQRYGYRVAVDGDGAVVQALQQVGLPVGVQDDPVADVRLVLTKILVVGEDDPVDEPEAGVAILVVVEHLHGLDHRRQDVGDDGDVAGHHVGVLGRIVQGEAHRAGVLAGQLGGVLVGHRPEGRLPVGQGAGAVQGQHAGDIVVLAVDVVVLGEAQLVLIAVEVAGNGHFRAGEVGAVHVLHDQGGGHLDGLHAVDEVGRRGLDGA